MLRRNWAVSAYLLTAAHVALAAPCLLNSSSAVGNPVFGATVQTFMNYGIDPNTTCIENGLWTNPSGFALGSYVKGADGLGGAPDPTVLAYNGNSLGGFAANANALDFYWVQDNGAGAILGGVAGGRPSSGIIWDLGGPANQAVVFPFVDHRPVPSEVLENTVWLSNDPDASDSGWTQAFLDHVYGAGWSADPNVADGFAVVYRLPDKATFRYVSVTWGGPGSIHQDGDNEIDAVGGLTFEGTGVASPEPGTFLMGAPLLLGIALLRRFRSATR